MKRATRKRLATPPPVRIPSEEQLLIDAIPEIAPGRMLTVSVGRGQFAATVAQAHPTAEVTCQYLDAYLAEQAQRFANEHGAPPNLHITCAADFPDQEVDVVGFAVDKRGEAELTRDQLQAAQLRLRPEGRFLASTGNSRDNWLYEEMQKLFPKVTRRPVDKRGVLYLATKAGPPKKIKHFESEFAYREQGRLIRAISRPGVFSHRSLDAGARTLMNAMEILPGERVLDIGCGSGTVAFAAAFRAEGVQVVAIDSNARAIDCTQRGAAMNGLTNITTCLNAHGDCGEAGTFDVALGNPPYFSEYRIAEIFLNAALRGLKPGGRVLMVTQTPQWFETHMTELFDEVEVVPLKKYWVARGIQRG